jgi:hypothetical protein
MGGGGVENYQILRGIIYGRPLRTIIGESTLPTSSLVTFKNDYPISKTTEHSKGPLGVETDIRCLNKQSLNLRASFAQILLHKSIRA